MLVPEPSPSPVRCASGPHRSRTSPKTATLCVMHALRMPSVGRPYDPFTKTVLRVPVFPPEILRDAAARDHAWRRCRRLGQMLWPIGRTCGSPHDAARGPLYALLAELLDIVEPDSVRMYEDPFNTELVWRPAYAAYYSHGRVRSMKEKEYRGSARRRTLARCLAWGADDAACVLLEFAATVPTKKLAACMRAVRRRYPRMPDLSSLLPARLRRYRPAFYSERSTS